ITRSASRTGGRTSTPAATSSDRPQFHHPLGARLGDVNRAVLTDREIVDGVEDGIARAPETDRRDDVPLTIELQDAGAQRVVVRAPNPDVVVAPVVRRHGKDTASRLGVCCAVPLALEDAIRVEQLQACVLAIRYGAIGAARNDS